MRYNQSGNQHTCARRAQAYTRSTRIPCEHTQHCTITCTRVADSQTLTFSAPDAEQLPELGLPANFIAVNANNDILDSLGGALSGVDIEPYTSNQSGILGGLLTTGVSTINGVLSTVEGLIDGLLAPLLEPVLSQLTNSLGIDLAKADVGANLSCGGRGRAELLL
ncbi:hypothetical protein [Pseudomonas sp.]|uniref:hypothetical protein n=1 Tax=Pseudomonas sp. TaxID=306 RepID=UPI00257F76BD|nr:hypothetical protein [Pseudomonas sp.]